LICPTIDRTSLRVVLNRVVPQLEKGDEFIVVGDGPCPRAKGWCAGERRVKYLELPYRVGDFGCTPCDVAMKEAKGDYIFLVGDDDLPEFDAFAKVRAGVAGDDPKRPWLHVFTMWHGHLGRFLGFEIEPATISGQQLVFRNDPDMIPRMADYDPFMGERYSDWDFIMRMIDRYGKERVMFHQEVICELPMQNSGKMF